MHLQVILSLAEIFITTN